MNTYLNDLIQSLEREAEEIRAHPPPRLMDRTIAQQNLKRIEQRLATLHTLRVPERDRKKPPGTRRPSSAADNLLPHTAQ